MARPSTGKIARQESLKSMLEENPFMTDEELAEHFSVSIPTIRLDRIELSIPEVRERVRNVAQGNVSKVRSLVAGEMPGQLVDIELNKSATLIMEADRSMVFSVSNVVKGQFIYSMAEALAIAVIDADVALVGVANIKYIQPVFSGDTLIAKAEVKRVRGTSTIVWVKTYVKNTEVFRGKFILVSIA